MTGPVVARISIAPVKALGLVFPDVVTVTRDGVDGDRRYALIDEDGRLVNGKRLGPLVGLRPELTEDPETLRLRLPDGRVVGGHVVLGTAVEAEFFGAPRSARLVLGEHADALTELVGRPVRLVRLTGESVGVDREADGAVTMLSAASLAGLADAAGLDAPVDGRRFRMTFTLDGIDAHVEDRWIGRRVRLGDVVVRPLGNVGRCAVTTQDPDTGIRSLDTLRLIAETRGHLPTTEPLPFGVHAEVVVPGRVRVGDPVSLDPADDRAA